MKIDVNRNSWCVADMLVEWKTEVFRNEFFGIGTVRRTWMKRSWRRWKEGIWIPTSSEGQEMCFNVFWSLWDWSAVSATSVAEGVCLPQDLNSLRRQRHFLRGPRWQRPWVTVGFSHKFWKLPNPSSSTPLADGRQRFPALLLEDHRFPVIDLEVLKFKKRNVANIDLI